MNAVLHNKHKQSLPQQLGLELGHQDRRHWLTGTSVRDQVQCPKDPCAACIADDLVLSSESMQPRSEVISADLVRVLYNALALHCVERRDD